MNFTTRLLLRLVLLAAVVGVCGQFVRISARQQGPAPAKSNTAPAGHTDQFYLHNKHVKEIGLDCTTCHVPVKEGSASLQRPGHEQCQSCHADAFDKEPNQKICTQCHTAFPPTSAEELYPFPRYKKQRPILVEFSHAKHLDPHQRIDQKTGMRADCLFCHQIGPKDNYITGHEQCASCHSKAGMTPLMGVNSTTKDCQGCHNPMGIENPSLVAGKAPMKAFVVAGAYKDIKFSHQAHSQHRGQFDMNCTTCHKDMAHSTSLATLDLPKMSDCGTCHSQQLSASHRMDNCGTCHVKQETGVALASYSRWIKPEFHNESFRAKHKTYAAEPAATCYICHTNLSPTSTPQQRCETCHQTMKPASHTVRWRDDVHGKFAALDRQQCTTCHVADTCVRCHNETPRSHEPLSFFKGGAHARLAMLNERACLTCHTFENTCAECHAQSAIRR
jgi:hypothetical protein